MTERLSRFALAGKPPVAPSEIVALL